MRQNVRIQCGYFFDIRFHQLFAEAVFSTDSKKGYLLHSGEGDNSGYTIALLSVQMRRLMARW